MFRLGRKNNILIERKQGVGAVLLFLLFDHLLCAVAHDHVSKQQCSVRLSVYVLAKISYLHSIAQ